jgi:hypothetical protein
MMLGLILLFSMAYSMRADPVPVGCFPAPPCYGLEANAVIQTSLPTTTLGGGGLFQQRAGTAGIFIPQTTFDIPLLSHSDSVTAFDPNGNGIYTISASGSVDFFKIIGPNLHVLVQSQGGNSDPFVDSSGEASADMRWEDTLFVGGGLPFGTPVIFKVDLTLDGNLELSGNNTDSFLRWINVLNNPQSAAGCLGLPGAIDQNLDYTSSNSIHYSQELQLCTYAGATLNLQEVLIASAVGSRNWSGSANFADTASVNIVSETPGATVTSASGIDYSAVATPEPSLLPPVLVLVSIIGVVAFQRRATRT